MRVPSRYPSNQIPLNIFEDLQVLQTSQLRVRLKSVDPNRDYEQERQDRKGIRRVQCIGEERHFSWSGPFLPQSLNSKKPPFEVDASATSIESIFPVKKNNKKQAALCACTQLHATRKISYNCRSIIERGTKCKKTITLHKQHKHMTLLPFAYHKLSSIVFRYVQIILNDSLPRPWPKGEDLQAIRQSLHPAGLNKQMKSVRRVEFFVGHVTDKK